MSRRQIHTAGEEDNGRLKCSNQKGRPLVVLAATTPVDPHHKNYFDEITDFQIDYAEAILGRDNVLIMCDPEYSENFHRHLPPDVVLEQPLNDIWIRDYAPIRMNQQTFFTYRPNYLKKTTANWIQKSLTKLLKGQLGSGPDKTQMPPDCELLLDGGNVVDNYEDKAIISERVFLDNKPMSEQHVMSRLRAVLGYSQIAIVPDVHDKVGHADDIVAFVDTNVVAVSGSLSAKVTDAVMKALKQAFGGDVKIVVLDSYHKKNTWRGFESACGLHVNLVSTYEYLYIPVFGHDPESEGQSEQRDETVLDQILANTSKTVVPVEVDWKISRMGGSLRNMSWTLVGPLADSLVTLARRDRRYNDLPQALIDKERDQ